MREAFIKALLQIAENNPKVVLLMAEVGFSVVEEFERRFPNRFYNVGISEQNLVSVAAGFALKGFKPIAYSMSCFLPSRAFEHIKVDVCYPKLPIVLVGVGTGLSYGNFDATHHATEDLAIMNALPNINIICPSDAENTKESIAAAIQSGEPCYIALGKAMKTDVKISKPPFKIGKAMRLREGNDAAIIATGLMVYDALAIADSFAKEGISISVVNMHSIKPFDKDEVYAAADTGKIFIMDEHTKHGGLTTEISKCLLESGKIPTIFYSFAIPDYFASFIGCREFLLDKYGISVDVMKNKIRYLLKL